MISTTIKFLDAKPAGLRGTVPGTYLKASYYVYAILGLEHSLINDELMKNRVPILQVNFLMDC